MRPVVCLHGFTGGPGAWDAVLKELPDDARVIRPAIVGHDRALPLTGRGFEDEIDRLAGGLPSTEGARFHLAGYSLGGRLALGLLVRHRGRFASATLIGAHSGLGTAHERRERRAVDENLARMLEEEGVERFVKQWQSLPLFATQSALPTEVLAAQRRRRLSHRAADLAHALRILGLGWMPDYGPQLPQLDLPIHLMAGARDDKFRHLAESMASSLPRATLGIVPGTGHNLLLEAPGAVAAAILRGSSLTG